MKNVILVNRRDGMTRDAYREHYENVHAPLGAKYFHFHKYVRAHVVEADDDPAEFDCYGEFWPAASAEETAELLKGPVAQIMIDDRAKFMHTRRTGGNVEEILLAGAPRGIEPPRSRREILLLRRRPEASREAFDAALRELAEQLVVAKRARRVILDRPVPGGPGLGNIQADGILQVWPAGTSPVIRGLSHPTFEGFGWVAAESYETLPEVLHAEFGGVPPA
jgi:hypothetical protein